MNSDSEMTREEREAATTAAVVEKLRVAHESVEAAYHQLADSWPHRIKAETLQRGRLVAIADLIDMAAKSIERAGGRP